MSTGIPMICQYCQRPIAGLATHIGHLAYHPECTHGPNYPTHYAPMPPVPGCVPWRAISEDDVRRIVRDEMTKLAAQSPVLKPQPRHGDDAGHLCDA
jgi:hypothetical protein